MSYHTQRGELIAQLDLLVSACLVNTYFLDGKTFNLAIRIVTHIQFAQPKQIQAEKPMRNFTILALVLTLGTLIVHLFMDHHHPPQGVFVDFIGQARIPPLWYLLGMDLFTGAVQLLLVLIAYSEAHNIPLEMPESDLDSPAPSPKSHPSDTTAFDPIMSLTPHSTFLRLFSSSPPTNPTPLDSNAPISILQTLMQRWRGRFQPPLPQAATGAEPQVLGGVGRAGGPARDMGREEEDVGG